MLRERRRELEGDSGKPVLSREEVAALLQGLWREEPERRERELVKPRSGSPPEEPLVTKI